MGEKVDLPHGRNDSKLDRPHIPPTGGQIIWHHRHLAHRHHACQLFLWASRGAGNADMFPVKLINPSLHRTLPLPQ